MLLIGAVRSSERVAVLLIGGERPQSGRQSVAIPEQARLPVAFHAVVVGVRQSSQIARR